MKRLGFIALLIFSSLAVSCAPVLSKGVMDRSVRNVPLDDLMRTPDAYRGKLLVFGGRIINTRLTAEGSLVEALYAPVGSRGGLGNVGDEKFLALLPREKGMLEPLVFTKDREITIAAEFAGMRQGMPFFRIEEIYLWDVRPDPYYPHVSPPYFYDLYDDPFFRGGPFLRRHRPYRY